MLNGVRVSVFAGSVEMTEEEKNAAHIAQCFDPYFEKYGSSITVVVTDSAAVMKAAGDIIMTKYPWVTWMPCVTHQAELMMKKITKLDHFCAMVSSIRGLVVWVKRHQSPAALFRKLSKKAFYIPGETRFGATVVCLETYLEVHSVLKQLFAHQSFKAWVKRQNKQQRIKAAYAESVLTNRELMLTCKTLVMLLEPIMQLLRLFDRGIPVTGFVYFAIAALRTCAAELVSKFKLVLKQCKIRCLLSASIDLHVSVLLCATPDALLCELSCSLS